MKFQGCFDLSAVTMFPKAIDGGEKYVDIVLHCYDDGQLTITLDHDQLADLQAVLSDAVEIFTEKELPYHV